MKLDFQEAGIKSEIRQLDLFFHGCFSLTMSCYLHLWSHCSILVIVALGAEIGCRYLIIDLIHDTIAH